MRIVLHRQVVTTLSIILDLTVVTAVARIRWQAQLAAIPDPDIPGIAELQNSWWKAGRIGDWLLYPGADAGLWAQNIRLWMETSAQLDTHRPPLYIIITGLATPLFGDLVYAGHMVNHLLSFLVCLLIYAFGRATSGRGAAMGAALLTAMSPDLLSSSRAFGVDPALQFVLILLALTSWLAAPSQRWRLIPLGIAGGLAAGAHFISFGFVVPACLLLLTTHVAGWRWWQRITAPLLALALSLIIWQLQMVRYPSTSLRQILGFFSVGIRDYNEDASADAAMAIVPMMDLFVSRLWETPLSAIERVLQALQHLSFPWPLLLALCALGLMGPGLRRPRSLEIDRKGQPHRMKRSPSSLGGRWFSGPGILGIPTLNSDWRPGLWLLVFLAPLVFATAFNAPHRYTLYCIPLLFLTATRGIASLGACFDQLISARVPAWPKGLMAFTACLTLVAGASSPPEVGPTDNQEADRALLQRVVGARAQQLAGDGACVVTATPEICFFAGCPGRTLGWCPETVEPDLGSCFSELLARTPCKEDLVYVQEPTKRWGQYNEHGETIDAQIRQRFEAQETIRYGEDVAVLYLLERDVLENLATDNRRRRVHHPDIPIRR